MRHMFAIVTPCLKIWQEHSIRVSRTKSFTCVWKCNNWEKCEVRQKETKVGQVVKWGQLCREAANLIPEWDQQYDQNVCQSSDKTKENVPNNDPEAMWIQSCFSVIHVKTSNYNINQVRIILKHGNGKFFTLSSVFLEPGPLSHYLEERSLMLVILTFWWYWLVIFL